MYSPCSCVYSFSRARAHNLFGGGGTADRETIVNGRARGQTGEAVKKNLNRLRQSRLVLFFELLKFHDFPSPFP